jgi:hypothetical protein
MNKRTIDESDVRWWLEPLIDAQPGRYDVDAIVRDAIEEFDLTGYNPTQTPDSVGDDIFRIILRHEVTE